MTSKKSGWRTCLVVAAVLVLLTCIGGTATCGGCLYYANEENRAETELLVMDLESQLPSHPRAAEHLATLAALIALIRADELSMNASARLAGARGLAMNDGSLSEQEIDDIMEDVADIVAHGGDVGSSGGSDFDWD